MSQKCLVIGLSIASGMKEVLLRVQDQTQFEVGKEYEIVSRELEPLQPVEQEPNGTAAPVAPATDSGTPQPPLTVISASDEIGTKPIIDKPTSDNACKQCFGTGVVSLFCNGESTGKTDVCQHCSGKGIEPATA